MSDAEPWEPAIADAKERQAQKRREHEYRHSDIGTVVQTLDRGPPANARDLAALVFDELKALSLKIRDGSTSDWRQHWNADRHNRPTNPKPEDACRDAVLSDLQERLDGLESTRSRRASTPRTRGRTSASASADSMFRWRSSEAATVTSGRRSEVNLSPSTRGIPGPTGMESTSCCGSVTPRNAHQRSAGNGLRRPRRTSSSGSSNRSTIGKGA